MHPKMIQDLIEPTRPCSCALASTAIKWASPDNGARGNSRGKEEPRGPVVLPPSHHRNQGPRAQAYTEGLDSEALTPLGVLVEIPKRDGNLSVHLNRWVLR